TYYPTKYGPVVEFFTPYFDVEGLTAVVNYSGTLGDNSQFVISGYCPGDGFELEEVLDVTKTAITSYTRTHLWDIDKKVETENEFTENDLPKIWLYIDGREDEAATWTVNVTYKGYEDSDYSVSGTITIHNPGPFNAEITGIVDELDDGTPITLDCGVGFPYTLPVGETLSCTYSLNLDDPVEAWNDVTVTTEEGTYPGEAQLIWGDPTSEVNDCITVEDTNPEFAAKYEDVELCAADYEVDEVETFTYSKEFTWEDYGQEDCGHNEEVNTATIVETEQSASATLLVNVQCYIYETAYAKASSSSTCFINAGFSQWGWTNLIGSGSYTWDLWAAAGQCNTGKGTLVGSVDVDYTGGCVEVEYNVEFPYSLEETHVYAGCDMFPKMKVGKRWVDTVAPGQYYNNCPYGSCSQVYVIAHAVVGIPDPDFGLE
ncbi:MAG: hypothetical protein CVT89_01265, partial [Candidatus Altiarchaeales archaeon HGW-Altiarchaeales-2]